MHTFIFQMDFSIVQMQK